MNTVIGLFLALIALFLIWLWASGRATAVWQDLWSGSASSGYSASGANNSGTSNLPNLTQWLPNLSQGIGATLPVGGSTGWGGNIGQGVG